MLRRLAWTTLKIPKASFFEIYRQEHTFVDGPSSTSTISNSIASAQTAAQLDIQADITREESHEDEIRPSTSAHLDEIAQREHLKKKLGLVQYRKIVYADGELDKTDLTKPPSPTNPHPFTPEHLPPTHSRALAPYVNTSSALQALVELGVDLFEVDTANPRLSRYLVRLDLERDLKPRLQWLVNEIGLDVNNLGTYLTRNPFFLIQDLDDMKVRVNYLESKKFTKDQIVKIIHECRYWINVDVQTMDGRLGWLQKEFKLSGDQIRKLLTKEPRVLQFGLGPLERITKLLKKELEFSLKEAKEILLTDPRVYMMDPRALTETYIYVNRVMRLSRKLIVEHPIILRCHLSCIRSRHEFLKKLGRACYGQRQDLPLKDEPSTIYESTKGTSDSKELIPVINMGDFLHPADRVFANRCANTYLAVYDEFLRRH